MVCTVELVVVVPPPPSHQLAAAPLQLPLHLPLLPPTHSDAPHVPRQPPTQSYLAPIVLHPQLLLIPPVRLIPTVSHQWEIHQMKISPGWSR